MTLNHDINSIGVHGLADLARRSFNDLVIAVRQAGALAVAAREIDFTMDLEHGTGSSGPATLKLIIDDIYRKHGIETRPDSRNERVEPAMTQEITNDVEECLDLARTELNVARARLAREISTYPGPIAGCDCQFNHLLATRSKIAKALAALELDTRIPSPKRA